MVVKFLLARHSEQEWDTDPQYQSCDDLDIGSWTPEGSAAAAVLFVMKKINRVRCGSRVLSNMRRGEVIEEILDLVEIAVVDLLKSNDSEASPQVNVHPDDFGNDLEDNETETHNEPDRHPQDQSRLDRLSRLKERSLGGLIRELMLQILWRASAVFITTHVGASQLVKKFTKIANIYILDEAAAATIPEAAQI